MRSSLLEEGVEGQPEEEVRPEAKQHGGTRNILLQPPVFLLFDDPVIGQSFAKERRIVAGRLARTRYAMMLESCCSHQISRFTNPIYIKG